jgi:DNA-3-methyladenine glycosylase
MGRILPQSFYARETETVARDLLGAVLCHRTIEGLTAGRIVETEAYLGEDDGACHAAAGFTNRTRFLYGPPGTAYVYLIYGMYWCVNAVTRPEGLPSAVLIRAIEPLEGHDLMRKRRGHSAQRPIRELTSGPGKLCIALGVTGAMNGRSLLSDGLTIMEADRIPDRSVNVSPRIGISRAAAWPLRFFEAGNPFASRTPREFRVTGVERVAGNGKRPGDCRRAASVGVKSFRRGEGSSREKHFSGSGL